MYKLLLVRGSNVLSQVIVASRISKNVPNVGYLVKFSSTSGSSTSSGTSSGTPPGIPEPPTNCCLSGCANCVWIQYAEELIDYYNDSGCKARAELDRLITDPTLKMFLNMELTQKIDEKLEKQEKEKK